MERFRRNKKTISELEQKIISNKKILVIGCGGLGGFVVEGLSRVGFMDISLCDYDFIEESNLNRQLLAVEENIGKSKVQEGYKRIKKINEDILVNIFEEKFPNEKINGKMKEYDLIIDCLDSIETRKKLEEKCIEENKKLVYASIAGNYGYFGVSNKDNPIINIQNNSESSLEKELGNPFYIVGIVASFQVYLAVKVVLDKEYLKKGFYSIDLNNMSLDEIVLD